MPDTTARLRPLLVDIRNGDENAMNELISYFLQRLQALRALDARRIRN